MKIEFQLVSLLGYFYCLSLGFFLPFTNDQRVQHQLMDKDVESVISTSPFDNPPWFPMTVSSLASDALFSVKLAIMRKEMRMRLNIDSNILSSKKNMLIWLVFLAKGLVEMKKKNVHILFDNPFDVEDCNYILYRLVDSADDCDVWKYQNVLISQMSDREVSKSDSMVIISHPENSVDTDPAQTMGFMQAIALQSACYEIPCLIINPHLISPASLKFRNEFLAETNYNYRMMRDRQFYVPMLLGDFRIVYEVNDCILLHRVPSKQRIGFVRRYSNTLDIFHFTDAIGLIDDSYYDVVVTNHFWFQSLAAMPEDSFGDIIDQIRRFLDDNPQFLRNVWRNNRLSAAKERYDDSQQ